MSGADEPGAAAGRHASRAPKVRPLAPRDRAVWGALFADYIAFYEASVPDAVIALTWDRLMAGGEGNPVGLVSVDGGDQPRGLAHALFHRSTWSPTSYCYLEDLFVAPQARGAGHGRALIAATCAEADRRGATRTYWLTREDNAAARALYDTMATRAPFVVYRR